MSSQKIPLARHIVTPVTAVLFVVSTITGIMLFFHFQGGMVKASHEWLSMIFSAIAIWHLVRNWNSFTTYFKHSPAVVIFVLTLVASLVFTGMTGNFSGSGGSPRKVFMALSNASLENTAPAFNLSVDEALGRLKNAGFDNAAAADTLNEIGKRAGKRGGDILFVLANSK